MFLITEDGLPVTLKAGDIIRVDPCDGHIFFLSEKGEQYFLPRWKMGGTGRKPDLSRPDTTHALVFERSECIVIEEKVVRTVAALIGMGYERIDDGLGSFRLVEHA